MRRIETRIKKIEESYLNEADSVGKLPNWKETQKKRALFKKKPPPIGMSGEASGGRKGSVFSLRQEEDLVAGKGELGFWVCTARERRVLLAPKGRRGSYRRKARGAKRMFSAASGQRNWRRREPSLLWGGKKGDQFRFFSGEERRGRGGRRVHTLRRRRKCRAP